MTYEEIPTNYLSIGEDRRIIEVSSVSWDWQARARAALMADEGHSAGNIASALQVSRSTALRWVRSTRLPMSPHIVEDATTIAERRAFSARWRRDNDILAKRAAVEMRHNEVPVARVAGILHRSPSTIRRWVEGLVA